MVIIYSKYAPLYSLSLFACAICFLVGFFGALGNFMNGNILYGIIFVIVFAAGVFILMNAGKLKRWEYDRNLRKNVSCAYDHCTAHPEDYEKVVQMNPKFAEKYTRDSSGNLITYKQLKKLEEKNKAK